MENLNFSKNLQIGINLGFEKVNDKLKDDLIDNYNINENKKNTIEELVPEPKNNLNLNYNNLKDIKGIKYKIDKESINTLKNLKIEEKHIKIKLNKLEENQKIIRFGITWQECRNGKSRHKEDTDENGHISPKPPFIS